MKYDKIIKLCANNDKVKNRLESKMKKSNYYWGRPGRTYSRIRTIKTKRI